VRGIPSNNVSPLTLSASTSGQLKRRALMVVSQHRNNGENGERPKICVSMLSEKVVEGAECG
jgi:hypothetical protein